MVGGSFVANRGRRRMIGKIQRVPLREVWRHEAYDFTNWLQDNLDVLNDILDLNLESAEREKSAGSFSVDLVAEDGSGGTVVIENQLARSDHDHLGKLVTYLAAFEAKAAVWLVADPRPEHTRAITWLNESTSASFYLVKAEAIRIGDSPPAPLLTVIVGPSDESRNVGQVKRELAERHHERHEFWKSLLEHAKTRSKLHAHISPGYETWLGTGAGRMGLAYNYVVNRHNARVELYIDRGKDSDEINRAIFEQLHTKRETIEQVFRAPLEWQVLEQRRACRILSRVDGGGYRDVEQRESLISALVDHMLRLEAALRPHVAKLTVG
jgi:hypothetical protein